MVELDYVVIGHITRDLSGTGFRVGGTAAYAALTARALGCRVGVVTSTGPGLELREPLEEILVAHIPARESTTFENRYVDERREQWIHSRAEELRPAMVPADWQAGIAHIGPVAQECDPAVVGVFGDAFVGLTPQGWMRQWDERGRVSRSRWSDAEEVLARADAVVLSAEDIGGRDALVAEYAARTAVLALTRGAAGCTVYAGSEVREFSPPGVVEGDPTGAGDVFAASFFYALESGHEPWAAARFANCLAAQSVTRRGLAGVPDTEEVSRCRRITLEGRGSDAHHLRAG